ncbi:MAG: EamA family transporter [Chloroflexi bacterium]|nr:EamA family transporter [Chloroflexota bacterium]
MPGIVPLLSSVAVGVVGQFVLKAAMRRAGPLALRDGRAGSAASAIVWNPLVWAGLSLYGISMVCWLIGLSQVELSYAFPFLSLSYVLILLGSRSLLGESIGWSRLVGVLAICLGVYAVAAG